MPDPAWAAHWQVDVPDDAPLDRALARTTHLAVSAHQDDLEIMAYGAIVACYGHDDRGFAGVVLTSGGGSPRTGPYARTDDATMRDLRAREQRCAARIGRYALLAQRGLESADLKRGDPALVAELASLVVDARPDVVLLHNPADRHPTHVAAFRVGLAALRAALPHHRPRQALGCEVWGSLDWLPAHARVALPTSDRPHLAAALLGVFDSQIAGGKRYDLAAPGRWAANATFSSSHRTDEVSGLSLAMDLAPLLDDPDLDPADHVTSLLGDVAREARERLEDPWRS